MTETAINTKAFRSLSYGVYLISADDGKTWHAATLGPDLGRYSFREWHADFTPARAGRYALKARATNQAGDTQPLEPLWNPAGYMRNVVETVRIDAA